MTNDWENDMANLIIRLVVNALALWVRIRAENAGLRGPRHRAMASG